MKFKLSLVATTLLVITAIVSCKKGGDSPAPPTGFQAITFKFGPDSTSFLIDAAAKTIKNMPRSCDVTQLGASAVLPAGYSISPNPATAKNYTSAVTYTVTTTTGGTYTVQITLPAYEAVNNPYGVYTAKQLNDIRKGLNDSYVLMNDIELPNLNAANAAATVGISDYATYGWYSVGTRYLNGGHLPFRGTIDGQNHIIKNFSTAHRPFSEPNPAGIEEGHNGKNTDGIFGYALNASIKNIGIQMAPAGINYDPQDEGYSLVGALVGYADSSSTITNCYVTGSTIIAGEQNVGGLIGRAMNSTVSKCYAALTPSSGNYVITAGSDAGGLIGSIIYSEVSDSYTSASVLGSVNVGGFSGGVINSNIKSSYASGNVAEMPFNSTGSLIASNNIGGFIGSVSSVTATTIQNCYATGAVAGANGTNSEFHKTSRIGGLIGSIANVNTMVKVNFCYATGAVSRVWTSATAPYLIGGLVGTTNNNVFITSSVCTNYWDKITTGQANLGGGNPALAQDNGLTANGKTTAEMKSSATYLNWDFSAVWNLVAGKNNGYPSLRSTNQ